MMEILKVTSGVPFLPCTFQDGSFRQVCDAGCDKSPPSPLNTPGGSEAAVQGNGDLAARSNGFTCRDCSLLSGREDALTTLPVAHGTSSRVYSRDRTQKRKARAFESEREISCPRVSGSSYKPGLMGLGVCTVSVVDLDSELPLKV